MNRAQFLTYTAITLAVLTANTPVPNAIAKEETNTLQGWQLTVTGLIKNPQNFTLTDLMAMPQANEYAVLICVDQPNSVVTEGIWTGVRLSYLLEAANVSEQAVKVAFYASDGFSTDLTLQRALEEDVILAYQKDSILIPETLRLVVPGKWGYKWISKIISIELVDYNFLGFWESKGYSDQADINNGRSTTLPDIARAAVFPSDEMQVQTATPSNLPAPSTIDVIPLLSPTPLPIETLTSIPLSPENEDANASPVSPSSTQPSLAESEVSESEPPFFSSLAASGVFAAVALSLAASAVVLKKKARKNRFR